MIPKVIHYIWVGGAPLSPLAEKCIESWKKFCPDYEIIRWDETNFDINENKYCCEAYENKKWAFVSDYMRVKILYENGGIYMDTDVEVIAPLDEFLSDKAFSGFENDWSIPTGIMACEKNHPFFKMLTDSYSNRSFLNENGEIDVTTNVVAITEICKENGFVPNGQKQEILDVIYYPKDYFCPKDLQTLKTVITPNTKTIHHFDGSWLPEVEREKQRKKTALAQHMDYRIAVRLIDYMYKIKDLFKGKK